MAKVDSPKSKGCILFCQMFVRTFANADSFSVKKGSYHDTHALSADDSDCVCRSNNTDKNKSDAQKQRERERDT